MRSMEVCNLKLDEIDFTDKLIFIKNSKGAKDRIIPVNKRALDWLNHYLEDVRPRFFSKKNPGDSFFLSWGHVPFRPNDLSKKVAKYLHAIGFEGYAGCHAFRHFFATQMLENGADIRYIQEMLGHENLETTQIYTRVSITKLKAVHEKTHPGRKKR